MKLVQTLVERQTPGPARKIGPNPDAGHALKRGTVINDAADPICIERRTLHLLAYPWMLPHEADCVII